MQAKMTLTDDVRSLEAAVEAFIYALKQSKAVFDSDEKTSGKASDSSTGSSGIIDPLDQAKKSALLVKAHTTKLALLLRTDPFTPTAIGRELNSLALTCITGFMTAYQSCDRLRWSEALRKRLKSEITALLTALHEFAQNIREKIAIFKSTSSVNVASSSSSDVSRGSLQSTGIVWDLCDKIVALQTEGLSGLLLERSKQRRALVEDAIIELEELLNTPEPLDDEGFVEGFEDEDPSADFDSYIPRDSPELKEQLVVCLKRLKQVVLLLKAIEKRRFNESIPIAADGYSTEHAVLVDTLMNKLREISEGVDNLAAAFYDLDLERVISRLQTCLGIACSVASSLEKTWIGTDDKCTAWLIKWQAEVRVEAPSETL
jgi:hypothetical protein